MDRIYFCADYEEYRVNVQGQSGYYTSDEQDAKETYKAMTGKDWDSNKRYSKGNPDKW